MLDLLGLLLFSRQISTLPVISHAPLDGSYEPEMLVVLPVALFVHSFFHMGNHSRSGCRPQIACAVWTCWSRYGAGDLTITLLVLLGIERDLDPGQARVAHILSRA